MPELATQDLSVDPTTMELVIVNGDLSKLNPKQRIAWYRARCEAAGLDPRTEPFQYLNLQGKLKLYATKAATDQLISNRKLDVQILERRHDQSLGVYEVQCRVTFPDKHSVEDFAAIPVKGLAGEQLCNALMKAVTKAKRRTVLSACGLGVMDETEVETIPVDPPQERAVNPGPAPINGHAEPNVIKAFDGFLDHMCNEANTGWLESITSKKTGELLSADAEIITRWQLREHLHKWARSMDWIRPGVTLDMKHIVTAQVWQDHMEAFTDEAKRYCRGLWQVAFKAAKAAHKAKPKPTPEVWELQAQDEVIDELLTQEAGSRG